MPRTGTPATIKCIPPPALLSSPSGDNTLQVTQSTLGKEVVIWLLIKSGILLGMEEVQQEPGQAGVQLFSILNPPGQAEPCSPSPNGQRGLWLEGQGEEE